MSERSCAHCGATFIYTDKPGNDPAVCYRQLCQASEWSADRWAALARMAGVRDRAGVGLSDLDHLALKRGAA